MFGLGKRKEPVELVEVLQQGEEVREEMWGVDRSQDMAWETVCAWCLAEQGMIPDSANSHGICVYHSAQVLQAYYERKAHL